MTAGWYDDEDMPLDPWECSDWPALTPAEVAALAERTRAALDAFDPPTVRAALALAWQAGDSRVRWDYGDRPEQYDAVVSVAGVDVRRPAAVHAG